MSITAIGSSQQRRKNVRVVFFYFICLQGHIVIIQSLIIYGKAELLHNFSWYHSITKCLINNQLHTILQLSFNTGHVKSILEFCYFWAHPCTRGVKIFNNEKKNNDNLLLFKFHSDLEPNLLLFHWVFQFFRLQFFLHIWVCVSGWHEVIVV